MYPDKYHSLSKSLEEMKTRAFEQNHDRKDVVVDALGLTAIYHEDEEKLLDEIDFVEGLLKNSPENDSTAEGQMKNAAITSHTVESP